MLDIVSKGLAKVFGTKAEKDLKEVSPLVQQINGEFEKLSSISDDELRGKTTELKSIIASDLKAIDDQLTALHKQVEDQPELDIHEKENIFARIDKLE